MRFLVILSLVAPVMFAQHAGGYSGGRGGGHPGGGAPGHPVNINGFPFRAPNRLASPFIGPYYGGNYWGGYGYWGDSSDWAGIPYQAPPEQQPPSNVFFTPPPPPAPVPQSVTREYSFPPAQETSDFVIALKDGSRRSAIITWVQDGKLYYLDPDGNRQVLSPGVIDRQTTLRLNREKNLRLQLP